MITNGVRSTFDNSGCVPCSENNINYEEWIMKFDKKCFINGVGGALVGLFVLNLLVFVAEGVVKPPNTSQQEARRE